MKLKSATSLFAFVFALQIAIFAQTNEVLINQASDAIEKQDYVSAISSLDIIFKRSPNNEAALTQRARIYVRQGKFTEASADVAKVLAQNPNNFEALNVRGVIKRERDKDLNGALADFNKAVTIKPVFYLGFINLGVTNSSLKKPNDAIAAFGKAIEIAPNNPQGYENRGLVYMGYSKYVKAIADYDKVISLSGGKDYQYAARANCHFRIFVDSDSSESLKSAKNDAEKALQLNPNNAVALSIRGIIRLEENKPEGGVADAEKAIQLAPKSFMSYMFRGFVRGSVKLSDQTYDNNGALEDFEQAYKLAPNDKWVKAIRLRTAKTATSPLAKTIQAESKNQIEAQLAKAQQKVAANPWDWNSYVELHQAYNNSDTDRAEFFNKLQSENPNNICAVLFSNKIHYLRPNEKVAAYDNLLRRFDGKNGKLCAADIASNIAIEYTSLGKIEEAKPYLERAKAINAELGGGASNVANVESYFERNKAEDDRLTKRLAELDKTTKQTSDGSEKRMSDKDFQALIAVRKEFNSLSQHSKTFVEYANIWNSEELERNRDLLLSMKTECEIMLSIAENLLAKYPNSLTANDTDYLKNTINKKKIDIAKIQKNLEKYPD